MTSNFGNWQPLNKTYSKPTKIDSNKVPKPISNKEGSISYKLPSMHENFDPSNQLDKTKLKSIFDSMKDKESSNSNSTQIKGEGKISDSGNSFDKLG